MSTARQCTWIERGPADDVGSRPIVFLHGLGGTSGSWNPQLDHFSATHRCLAWDMPGYGDSDPEVPLTYEAIADRLVAMLDDAEIDQADLVGLSFGGMHALHTALRHSTRIGRMVLANTSPAFGMDGTDPDEWKQLRLGPLDAGETPATMAPRILDAIAGRPLDPAIRAELITAFGRISSAGLRASVECLPHNDIRDRLHELDHHCLVIAGKLDDETPVSYAQVLADGLSNARLEILSGIGHLSPSEDPAIFNDLVERFLAERR